MEWENEIPGLPFIPDEIDILRRIIDAATKFRAFVSSFTNSPLGLTSAEVPTMRFYLRKIEGAEILLGHETNFFRAELHKWMPIAPEPPPAIVVSASTRKPRPTKQQKLMQQMGIKNPEDLPPQYRTKAHVFRKKSLEANGKPPPPIQPAPAKEGTPTVKSEPGQVPKQQQQQLQLQLQQQQQQQHQQPLPAPVFDYSSQHHHHHHLHPSQRFGPPSPPTFHQSVSFGGSPGSPVLMSNPGRGQTLDPPLFNPTSFHGHRPATTSSSNSPQYNAASSREVNNMFEQLTNHNSTDLYSKDPSGLVASGFDEPSSDSLDSMANQFLA